jgi:UDP-glucose 4-epimerase
MKKILVTGGAGFIGYFLIKKLLEDRDNEIVMIDNMYRGRMDDELKNIITNKNVTFQQGDLTDKDFIKHLDKDFDYIYHLAAVIGVKNVIENPDKVLSHNAIATLNLIEFAKNLKSLKKILFSSTSEIYAGTLKHYGIDIPTNEEVKLTIDDIKSPRTTYMLSKMYGESILFNYGFKYNIPFTIVRYHNVYGPRMGFLHVIPEMLVKISKQKIIEVASPEHTRSMCFIDDAIEMTIKACESNSTKKEILNIGNQNQETSIINLVKIIADVLDKKIKTKMLPDTKGSPKRRCPDISKIINLTGYTPKVNIKEGLKKTYNWYKNKLSNKYE